MPPQKVILVHKGALGDFLQVWPSLYTLTQLWPEASFFWAGKKNYALWTEPLGIQRCPGPLLNCVDSLYGAESRPQGLEGYLVIWFGLKRSPLKGVLADVWFLPGLPTGELRPPRERYAQELIDRGLMFREDWVQAWRSLCGRWTPKKDGIRKVLLFPGAGHHKKCWPLDKYHALAEWLETMGQEVSFVYGPAERERGIMVQKFEQIFSQSFQELQGLLSKGILLVGNDCGTLHLAGYLGAPGLALFGPTSTQQWGPYGIKTLSLSLNCSPCSDMADIACAKPVCLESLPLEQVQQALLDVLAERLETPKEQFP